MLKIKLAKLLFFCVFCVLMSGCGHVTMAPNNYVSTDTSDLNQLLEMRQSVGNKKRSPANINDIRIDGIKEVAMTLGAQGALANRSQTINKMLERGHGDLDQVYNFQSLLLAHNVLPPVLAEGTRTLSQNDNSTVRLADKTYRIVEPAKFITVPPNWREYLLLTYEKPDLPDYSLLPRGDSQAEKNAWRDGINEGWQQGSYQANQIFSANLSRLQRDYNGMLLYRRLVNYQMITSPVIAETKLGITGGGDELTINDRFKRITMGSGLVSDANQWRPAISQAFAEIAKPAEQPMRLAEVIPDMQPQMQSKDIDPSTYIK